MAKSIERVETYSTSEGGEVSVQYELPNPESLNYKEMTLKERAIFQLGFVLGVEASIRGVTHVDIFRGEEKLETLEILRPHPESIQET